MRIVWVLTHPVRSQGRRPVGLENQIPGSSFSGKYFQWEMSLPHETGFFDPLFDTVSSLTAACAVE